MPLPLIPQNVLDFTGLSREDILVRLQGLANQAAPTWVDFSTAHPENVILELTAMYGDIIRGVTEERVRQLSWATVTDRLAAIRLGRSANFTLTGATPATVDLTFTTANGAVVATRIPIPEGTIVTANNIRYRVTSVGLGIEIGTATQVVSAEQADVIDFSFDSSAAPNTELLLDRTPYIDGSVVVSATDGAYAPAPNGTFAGTTSGDKYYVVFTDSTGRARIRFGNGITGAIPQGEITGTYKVGGGSGGDVEANVSWQLESPLQDTLGNTVNLIVTNVAASVPGTDAMAVAEARTRGPLALRTATKRAVNEADHEDFATANPTIARAFMATAETSPIVAEDEGILYLIAYGTELASGSFQPTAPSTDIINSITASFNPGGSNPSIMGSTLTVRAAPFKTVNVVARIYKTQGANPSAVAAAIRANLADLFAVADSTRQPNANVDFGHRLKNATGAADFLFPWTSVLNAVRDATGVRRMPASTDALLLNGVFGDILLAAEEFPKLGSVTIFDLDQGGAQI